MIKRYRKDKMKHEGEREHQRSIRESQDTGHHSKESEHWIMKRIKIKTKLVNKDTIFS